MEDNRPSLLPLNVSFATALHYMYQNDNVLPTSIPLVCKHSVFSDYLCPLFCCVCLVTGGDKRCSQFPVSTAGGDDTQTTAEVRGQRCLTG